MLLLHGTVGNQTGMPKDRGYFRLLRELANITLLYANEDPYKYGVFFIFIFDLKRANGEFTYYLEERMTLLLSLTQQLCA